MKDVLITIWPARIIAKGVKVSLATVIALSTWYVILL